MLVIDAHTHWYPAFVSRDPSGWAALNSEAHWRRLMAPRADGKRNLQGFPDIGKFLRDMDDAGVERSVIQGWYWERRESCEILNAAVADAVAAHADRLSAFCAINPAEKDLEESLRRARDMGFSGIGELHGTIQGFSFASDNFSLLCERAAEYNMPVSVHLTDSGGKDYPNKVPTDNDALRMAAKLFPQTKFIFAHWGGGEVFREDFEFLPNVFYDAAANSFLYGREAWRKVHGPLAGKMIYGSDYPLRLYPSLSKEEEMARFAGEAAENLPAESMEKVFSANFLSLYGNP